MSTSAGRQSSRDKLIDAAAELITRHGVQELTLEGVAAAVGVTKGGLIYHFKTKDDLLGALVERLIGQLDQRSRDKAAQRGDSPAALLHALVDETFDMPAADKALLSNLLAAATHYPHLMAPAQQLFARQYEALAAAGPRASLALVFAAALDGISLLELLNLHHFDQPQRDAMRAALGKLADSLA
jgi:AcrR family transcriptional regulator